MKKQILEIPKLIKKHPNYLGYSFLHFFFSGLGQSFLIGIFKPEIISSFKISNEEFSIFYGLSTLVSGLTLPFMGKLVDKVKIRYISVCCAILLACFTFCISITSSLPLLFIALFGLRFFGQGMLPLIGSTSIARHFVSERGRMLSIASLGMTLSEAILSGLVTYSISTWGWKPAYQTLGILLLLVFIPCVIILIKKNDSYQFTPHVIQNTHNEAFKIDMKFIILVATYAFPMFFLTGMFIHKDLVEYHLHFPKNTLSWGFIAYGSLRFMTNLSIGPIVDKFSGQKVFVFSLLPLVLGLTWLLWNKNPSLSFIYLGLAGITTSISSISSSTMWVELYGTQNLGKIKSIVSSVMIISTSLGTLLFGFILQYTPSMSFLIVPCILYIIVTSVVCIKMILIKK